jgi:hypothetical protein
MKVLLLWNMGGAFTPVAQRLAENENDDVLVIKTRDFDGYGHVSMLNDNAMLSSSPKQYYKDIIKSIRKFKPDVIHVAGSIKSLVLSRCLTLRTPIFFTYHGDEIRGRKSAHGETKLADQIAVTTQDLKQYGQVINRPIGLHFYDRKVGRNNLKALMFYNDYWFQDTRPLAQKWCKERGMELTIIDLRQPEQRIPYDKMPEVYSEYTYFLDFKGHGKEKFALSKAALEASACGCIIVHDSDLNRYYLPDEINPPIADDWIDMYLDLKKASVWKGIKRVPRILLGVLRWGTGKLEWHRK